jgi:hypothetical protein
MKRIHLIFIAIVFLAISGRVQAQLSLTATSTTYTIDFQSTIPGVNLDAFSTTAAAAMFANPPASGQLDANAWTYVKDVAIDTAAAVYPGSGNADVTALTVPGGASTIVGWGSWNIGGNSSFAMLPSGSNGTPGTLTLKISNNTGSVLSEMDFGYYVAAYNDQARANKVEFLYSTDNVTWVRNTDITFTSSLVATSTWEFDTKTKHVSGLNIPAGGSIYIRWAFNDAGGSGSRDEFLIDDITVMGSAGNPTIPTKLAITAVNGGISPSANTTFSVTVQSQNSLGQTASVSADKVVTLNLGSGSGNLGGTLTGTITAGSSFVNFTDLTYSIDENNVTLTASAPQLASGTSDPFNVLEAADHLEFVASPLTGTTGVTLGTITVEARRGDNTVDPNFHSAISLLVSSGPGSLSGTATKITTAGSVNFTDIALSAPGEYVLLANSGNLIIALSETIEVGQGMQMAELVVPKYIGSKSAASVNNCRSPYSVCLSFTYLQPNTSYDLRTSVALTSEPVTSFGAGNVWTGTAFGSNSVTNYFTTDANGNSGPVWVYCHPTGNATRFDAGQVHNLRIGLVPNGQTMPTTPTFVGTKTMTALDIPITARTVATNDDGAFLRGHFDASWSGKMLLVYSNVDGSGDPLYAYQVRQTTPTPSANTDLPGIVDSLWRQVAGAAGDWAVIIPVGEVNPNGVRRIEARNADNTLFASVSDADGTWSTTNTSNPLRRDVLFIDQSTLAITQVKGKITYGNTANTDMDSVHVFVKDANGNVVSDTYTDVDGNYVFDGMANGTYSITCTTTKPWGGANSVDALGVLRHFVGLQPLTGIYLSAANMSGETPAMVNSLDALIILQGFTSLISTFPSGPWFFEGTSVTVNGPGIYTKNIKALCFGDVNGSHTP